MAEQKRKKQWLVNFNKRSADKNIKGNPDHFIFFDTETKQTKEIKKIGKKEYLTTINTLDFGFACYWNKKTDETEWLYFTTFEEFHLFISACVKKSKGKTIWIIAHNIVFDNFITNIWEYFERLNYKTNFIHSKGMVYLQSLSKITATGKVKSRVMLINNGNIFPTTLKNIGETIGLIKLEMDFENKDKYTREEFLKYGKRDVEILLEFWKTWSNFISENDLGKLKFTLSSQSMEAFKKKFCENYVLLDDDLQNLAFERKCYYGGRTEIFFKGQVKKNIYYYDVNSMYPSVMFSSRYPTEYKFSKTAPTVNQVEFYIKKGWLICAECNIITKSNNCYPVRKNNTLIFPVGSFKTFLCTPEVNKAIEQGDLESFGNVSFYHSANLFESYIEFFYNKRMELKAQGNKQEKMFKLFLNSLYGKFGQMFDSWKETTIEEIKQIDENFDFGEWVLGEYKIPKMLIKGINITPNIRYIGGQLQISCEKEESQISFPAIAGHVTSYARLILWEAIKYCKDHHIKYYYCDTDSIFTDKPLPADLVNPDKLGMFKLETEYKFGVDFINLKNYCELTADGKKVVENDKGETIQIDDETFTKESKIIKGSHWKMKGVSNSAVMIDENTFIQQEWGGLPRQEYYTNFGRKAGEFWVIEKTKTNHDKINKGTLQTNGNITPFNYRKGEQ